MFSVAINFQKSLDWGTLLKYEILYIESLTYLSYIWTYFTRLFTIFISYLITIQYSSVLCSICFRAKSQYHFSWEIIKDHPKYGFLKKKNWGANRFLENQNCLFVKFEYIFHQIHNIGPNDKKSFYLCTDE